MNDRRAVLASFFLKERLGRLGVCGCALCLIGSLVIIMRECASVATGRVERFLMMLVCLQTRLRTRMWRPWMRSGTTPSSQVRLFFQARPTVVSRSDTVAASVPQPFSSTFSSSPSSRSS